MQKYFIKIMVILLLGITIMIMIHKNHHCTSKNQSPLSSWESAKETLDYYEAFKIKKLFSTRLKRSAEEQLIPKIKITAACLEKIKNYIFSEPINPTLLPTDLSEQEQEEINKFKNSWGLCLGYLNEDKDKFISEEQKKCDEYQSQLNILPKMKSFEQQKLVLEEQLETKEKELDRKTNKAEIKKLQDEISEIVGEIGKINVEIQNLEAIRIMYQNMLTRAENYKKILEEQYEIDKKKYKDSIIYKLNKLYDITSAEG
ncbi:MAG: effector [Sweet potato little leaf phytoplasma]|uniref:effector n=1 Tax=Candidatus Phytoplasma australasiaticum TaxID=2754999 RepID=UPI002109E4C8|nr:effector [Sweet potato little leaf phytoplasma]MDV3178230.1 effector [Sweet potato little leaf phytoplasma]MDV3188207.1 effector [Sweet potato little leaf phytoplasma]MDV3199461.1 effector [Sweet potato little leaf phytoplasma]MDV3203232.1 effector [Sweet potato little leaf phytoplasma]